MPLKKAKKVARPTRSRRAVRSKRAHPSAAGGRPAAPAIRAHKWSVVNQWGVVIGAICIFGAVALIATSQPAPSVDSAGLDRVPDRNAPPEIGSPAETGAPVESRRLVVPVVTTNRRAVEETDARTRAGDMNRPVVSSKIRSVAANAASPLETPLSAKSPAPAAQPSTTEVAAAAATPKASAELLPPARPVESNLPADVRTSAASEISGCLEFDDGMFRLKDTAGADLPTSRSWKSGFLRKRPSSIEIVDPAQRVGLSTFTGQRVVATGTLIDRRMQVRSLQPMGDSCS